MGRFGRARVLCVGLALASGQALGCLPGDFDELARTTEGARPCDPLSCADASEGGASLPDASLCDPVNCLDSGGRALDSSVADDAGGEAPDAPARDAGTTTPVPPCGGGGLVCQGGAQEENSESCGDCGSGVRKQTRTCAADGCSWSAWSAFGACTGEHTECDPDGPAQTQEVACPTCGSKTQSRSCSASTCTWGAWSDTSACTWCEECSKIMYCDTPADIANRGTWCRQEACSREQALADCKEDVKNICGAMTQPFFMEYK